MTQAFLKHPALMNPLKCLKIEKRHAASLYDSTMYSRGTVESNPFAIALKSCNMEGYLMQLPRGELIQICAEKSTLAITSSSPSKHPHFDLLPVLDHEISRGKFFFAPAFILNNRTFVEQVLKKRNKARKYVPRKIAHSMTSKYSSDFVEGFPQCVYDTYLALLLKTHWRHSTDGSLPSMMLVSHGPSITFEKCNTIINVHALAPSIELRSPLPLVLNYTTNKMPCNLILRFLAYTDCKDIHQSSKTPSY